MAQSRTDADLRAANFRLCQLCTWPNYAGLGFELQKNGNDLHIVDMVESNSPALAGGLKILDMILRVNGKDMSKAKHGELEKAIRDATQIDGKVAFLVVAKSKHQSLKNEIPKLDKKYITEIRTPSQMPSDYARFSNNKPRTCDITVLQSQPLGLEVANGSNGFGVYLQGVTPGEAADRAGVRNSDRLVEINDEFVDDLSSEVIKEKLGQAKRSGFVKLYVYSTSAYKYYKTSNIPLASSEQDETASESDRTERTVTSQGSVRERIHTRTTTSRSDPPLTSYSSPGQALNGVRLCSVTRANPTDPFGFEHNYNQREAVHTLKLSTVLTRDGGPTNAARAGIKSGDYLIEVNGKNVERLSDTKTKQLLRTTKYPEPLRLLVADPPTYDYYKQQKQTIHAGLVKSVPTSVVAALVQPLSSTISRSSRSTTESSSIPRERDQGPFGIAGLVNNNPVQPRTPGQHISPNYQQYKLKRIPGFDGYGFSVTFDPNSTLRHKINQITPGSPAEYAGLKVHDGIRKVNGHDVEDKTSAEFDQFLKREAEKSARTGEAITLEVIQQGSTLHREPRTHSRSGRTPTSIMEPSMPVVETYPELRRCTIRTWPENPSVGFQVTKTRSAYGGDALRLQQLQTNSAAAQTNLRNDDYIIEVNGHNIETEDDETVQDLIEDAYENNKQVEVLVIDDHGYQWYKKNRYPINSSDVKANVTRHTTPDPLVTILPSFGRPDIPSITTSIRSRDNRSRGAIDVVTEKRLLRFCRLTTTPGQQFGFQLQPDEDRHIIDKIEPNSPASRAGLNDNDLLVEVENENVERRSSYDVAGLIRNAAHNGVLRLFVTPAGIKALTKQSAKSLSALNDNSLYRNSPARSITDDLNSQSLIGKSRSVSRLNYGKPLHDMTDTVRDFVDQTAEPTAPLPRKCVLLYDSSYRGCGFRLVEKEGCDTPIVLEVLPHSPAKRSGVAVGDHVIYVDSQNVQNFGSFNEITRLIQRIFEENGQVTLVTITASGYQVLKRRGGYLDSTVFDYRSPNINQMKPRLCRLHLSNQEDDFGFSLQRSGFLYVDRVEQGSSADNQGLREDDVILELNDHATKDLSTLRIKDIIEASKQEGKLKVLVIDDAGYQFSVKHAIPLNSLLSFVQERDVRAPTVNSRTQNEPIYL